MDIFSTNFSLTYIWYIKQHCEYHCHNSKHEYVCSLWMTWKWQKKKKNSLKPKNQYIVPFNLLITWSSLRSKPLWRYMMLWGNLNNCIEILKCCVWKLILELFVTSSSEDFFFFSPNSISPMYSYIKYLKDYVRALLSALTIELLIFCQGISFTISSYQPNMNIWLTSSKWKCHPYMWVIQL